MRVIGHRGAMGHAPENTLLSIEKALELGASWIEVDVQAADGHLVVFHDIRLERVTNGIGYVSKQRFSYLRSLDAGAGQKIPTLDEVFEQIGQRVGINIELKGPNTAAPVAELIGRQLSQGWARDRILVSSFNHPELMTFKKICPNIDIGPLVAGIPLGYAAFAQAMGAFSVHTCLDFIDSEFVKDARRRNLKLFVYTVNHPEDIARMQDLGVDGVFTDFPERVACFRGGAAGGY